MTNQTEFSETTIRELAKAIGVNPHKLTEQMDRFVILGKGMFVAPTTNNAVRSAERIVTTWIKVNQDEDF